ncbi:MAG: hypothetical protein DMG40_15965 [Acidobacteria bacterium]|nr:MAG: hypothetical protein DMG40_15965 [Acidobacteriota bacterium]
MRQTSSILYIAVDDVLPERGRSIAGFQEFTATLDHKGIPAVWVTSRSRLQFDEPRRKLGHAHPFIAEDGCGVYLPEDYFHLRPDPAGSRSRKESTLRLGRFTCIPIAEALPAASEALEALSQEMEVPVVTLRSLSVRELAQNTGLLPREAEIARQRDFDEPFFFAGASEAQIERFLADGRKRRIEFRRHGVLWSAAIGGSLQRCIATLSRLYDRALRYHAPSVGVATARLAPGILPFCERNLLLTDQMPEPRSSRDKYPRVREIACHSPAVWEQVLTSLL